MTDTYSSHRPHPWHGLSPGKTAPSMVNVFVESTPFDMVKYEIDKETGYLHVDRPHRSTSAVPCLYGFIPRTYCAENVADLSIADEADHDPLDICVLSERTISQSRVTLEARVLGGLRMIDHGEADDKIIAVLDGDLVWGETENVEDLPQVLVERLRHYFLTYKLVPGEESPVTSCDLYGRDHAMKVVIASMADYGKYFPEGGRQ